MPGPFRPLVAVLCFLLAVAFAASPFFLEEFGGFDPDQFPVPQIDPPVTPAGYAFAIWGIIYLWLVIGMGCGALVALRDGQWHDMRLPLCISFGVGAFWLSVALVSPIWASVMIWVMLLSALAALFVAPVEHRAFAALPVGLYAGWLSAASCVSLGLLAAGYGWLEEQIAALVFISLAIVLAVIVQAALRRTPTYGLAVIWALVAIAVENWTATPPVAWLATGGAIFMLLPTLTAWRKG